MENFILYEELGAGDSSVVYKGRRKGSLIYVAIICTDKKKRPEITNHVRLSHDLNHPNIVRFCEWYETVKHLWLVVELCAGGSLETVVRQDGCLPEDVVRRFGWDLVKGLKHIHETGIIFSDLTPAKILLDASGTLKFRKFCLSKAEGETVESFFNLLYTSEEAGEDGKEKFDNMRKRLQGSPTYRAPEVLLGQETSMCSDIWALGCILYYMYSGKPPFSSDDCSELTEMILHQESPPARQAANPPSEDFQNLLRGLLHKNPNKRLYWPELLDHCFWTQMLNEEEGLNEEQLEEENEEENNSFEEDGPTSLRHTMMRQPFPLEQVDEPTEGQKLTSSQAITGKSQQAVTHATGGTLRNSQSLGFGGGREANTEHDPKLTVKKTCHTVHPSITLDNVSELKPKCGVNEDNTEGIFLLSSHANSRRHCSISETPSQDTVLQASPGTDLTSCVKDLLYIDSDLAVTPVIDNPKILKTPPVRFDSKTLCVPAYSVEKLLSFSAQQWTVFISQLCSFFEEQKSSNSPPSTASRARLNVHCYLCCVVGHKVIANRLINSTLLPVLTRQLQQGSNWDVRCKVLRVIGLLALHCTELREDSSVSEVVSVLTELLRDNLRNNKLKQFLLPPLGEFLYLIASQEEKRGSPEGLWFVPAAAYTGLMRSLREGFLAGLRSIKLRQRELPRGLISDLAHTAWGMLEQTILLLPGGDDFVVHHMAAKIIENISATGSCSSHQLATTEIGSTLWYLFTCSPVEAVRVAAISSLSRLTRLVPAVFLAVIDTCSPAAILDGVGGAGARVQQHLLTAMAAALVTSVVHIHRVTQSRDLVLKVMRCLESPSTVTRAKAFLLLVLLIQDDAHTLLYCCQNRLVMYLERDLRKAPPIRENPSQSGYLSQCLDVMIVYVRRTAPSILDKVLCALKGVMGRRHPSAAQSRQLKHTLPTMSVLMELLSSQVFRSHIVSEEFLAQTGLLLDCITSIDSNETNLASALGAAGCEEFIRTALSIVEVLSQHHTLIAPHHNAAVVALLPPLTSLVFSRNVEWSVFALRVLTELSLILLVQDGDAEEDEERTERGDEGNSSNPVLALISKSLLPRYESLLQAAAPIPLYAFKLLVSVTEHNTGTCRLIKHSGILLTVFQLIMACGHDVTSGIVQNAVALLCNLSGDRVLDLEPLQYQGLIKVVVSTLSDAASLYLDAKGHAGKKSGHLVLPALLELLHNILKQTSTVVRSALQTQRLSCPAVETEAAEKLLLANRPLSQLSTHLIQMLSAENHEISEESLQCLSLLVQLYGAEGHDCLAPSCLQSFAHVLRARAHGDTARVQRTALRVIKRLVQTTDRPGAFESPEGEQLVSRLQDITASDRFHDDVVSLAAEVLQNSGSKHF